MNTIDFKKESLQAFAVILRSAYVGPEGVDELASDAGVSKSSAYRWRAGECDPDFFSICALIRQCGDDELRMAITEFFVAGTGLKIINDSDGGGTSKQAVMANAFNASEQAVTFTRKIERAVSDGVVTPSETVDIRRTWDQVKAEGDAAVLGAEKMSERSFRIGGVA